MKKATVARVNGAINWDALSPIEISESLHGEKYNITAQARICYDDTALYLRLNAKGEPIRAEETGPIGTPCSDSCLEFFFCPMEGDKRYFNFEFNPNLCLYLGLGTGLADLTRMIPEEEEGNGTMFTFQPTAQRDGDNWSVTYRIPYAFIRRIFPTFTVFSGKRIRANFYSCADLTEPPHYLTWNPITRQGCGVFHTPEQFGELTFE